MALSITDNAKKLWDAWNIRGLIILSLSLQTYLILFAPLRKGRFAKNFMSVGRLGSRTCPRTGLRPIQSDSSSAATVIVLVLRHRPVLLKTSWYFGHPFSCCILAVQTTLPLMP
ncbi:hypothetical protein SLA2020_160100 [Shorea laevis]